MKRKLLAIIVIVVGTFAIALPALAHHPEIDSTATCDGTVNWTATAWVTGDPWRRTTPNDSVEIYRLIGDTATLIAVGEFNVGNGYSFSGSLSAPNGQLVRLRVVATEGFYENPEMTNLVAVGSFRDANVRVPDPCPPTTTTTQATTTTTTEETTTTTVAETTTTTAEVSDTTAQSTTTTEPDVDVGGIVVTNPSNPQVGSTASTLPFTGMSTGSLAVVGFGLVSMGLLLTVMSRRGDDKSAERSWS